MSSTVIKLATGEIKEVKDSIGKMYRVTMEDGSEWEVPVILIACSHAEYYAKVDEMSFEDALKETSELFENDEYEVQDWASGNMDWDDVESSARMVKSPSQDVDYRDGWINGESEVV